MTSDLGDDSTGQAGALSTSPDPVLPKTGHLLAGKYRIDGSVGRAGRGAVRRSAAFTLACILPLACGELLGIEEPHRIGDEQAGSSGAAGDAGDDGRGGTAGTVEGGSAGSGAQAGAAGATAAGGSMGGEGGAAPDLGPMLGAPCDVAGVYSCTSANRRLVLLCGRDPTGGPLSWHEDDTCFDALACDANASPSPRCEVLASQCEKPDATRCGYDGVLYDCSDPFHYVQRSCPFGCEGGRCVALSGDQLIVHTEQETRGAEAWPRSIPICFVAPAASALSAWLRDEVEHSLARYLDVEWSFGECATNGVARVAVELLHDCRERLGSWFNAGYPGDGTELRVGICASYFDALGQLQQMVEHEALFRFVVRHQFGHVLGRSDAFYTKTEDAMVRGVEESHAAEKVISDDTLVGDYNPGQLILYPSLVDRYGRKPAGSLVTPAGYCLTPSGGPIGPRACSSSKRFGLESAEVRDLSSTSQCFEVHASGEAVTLGACGSPSTAVRFARARWSTPSLCIAPRGQSVGSHLEATSCAPVGHASQAWHFEIISRDAAKLSARIRPSGTNLCLTASNAVVVSGDVPSLQACEDGKPEQTFSLWPNGKISLGPESVDVRAASCLTHEQPRGVVSFFPCVWATKDPRLARRFFLSGPLETPTGALRLAPNAPSAVLTLSPLGDELPAADQIFDFSF